MTVRPTYSETNAKAFAVSDQQISQSAGKRRRQCDRPAGRGGVRDGVDGDVMMAVVKR
jgi:hypothetical protein